MTHLKRPWCWERLRVEGEGDDKRWDGWMASPTRWTWVWVNSGSWWWTGRPSMLQSMGSQRVRHDWVTELNWTETGKSLFPFHFFHDRLGAWAPIPRSALTKFLHYLLRPLHLLPFSSLAQYVPAGMNSFHFLEHIELFLHRNSPTELSIIIIKRTFCRDDKVPY